MQKKDIESSSMSDRLRDAQHEIADLKSQVKRLETSVIEVNSKNIQLEEKLNKKQNDFDQLYKRMEEEVDLLRDELEKSENAFSKLKDRFKLKESEAEDAKDTITRLMERMQKLKMKQNALQAKLSHHNNESKIIEEKKDDVFRQIKEKDRVWVLSSESLMH